MTTLIRAWATPSARLLFVYAAALSASAHAEQLRGDAVLCETEAPLALLAEQHLANQPGSVVMKRVAATVEFYGLQGQSQAALESLANREQAIWRDSRTPDRGATSARAASAKAEQQKSAEAARIYGEFKSRCAATPPQEQPAAVLERLPISKLVRVKTALGGREAELWTHDYFLK